MTENQNQPREYDTVLGGESQVPFGAAVLGGITGVKSRLASPIVEVRIAALSEALKYGDAGLDLIVGALQDESMAVKFAAYSLLKNRDKFKLKRNLPLDYLPTFKFDVITVDAYGREKSRTKSFARFFPEDLGNGIMLEMVYIPGGTFMMGSPETEEGRSNNEGPQHQVTVPAFFAGKYPITQAQWQIVMGNNSWEFKGEKRPVDHVSWIDAAEFCSKLSKKTGNKYRILSEAEWEYACRAGTTTPFHFGETITPELVNYNGDYPYANGPKGLYRKETTDVGSFPPNAFGLYDMHGNVWEWCSDIYTLYNGVPTDSHRGKYSIFWRVKRGGFSMTTAGFCRSSCRADSLIYCRGFSGFRVAVDKGYMNRDIISTILKFCRFK